MNKILITLSLLLTMNSTVFASYDDEYTTDEDGVTIYIGDCKLHEDYENKKYKIKEIVPYTSYPSSEFVRSLSKLNQELIRAVYDVELAPYLEMDFWLDLDESSFDDISIDEVKLHNSKETLYRVSFGVGGGNGGYITYRALADNSLEQLARTFDGELLECSQEFRD